MNLNMYSMNKEPKYVAFSTQKGGVGKTTFTVLAASYLHYLKGLNVLVADCDYPQYSIQSMRKRDSEQVMNDDYYKQLLMRQFEANRQKPYPVINCEPSKAIAEIASFLENSEQDFDVAFFDLPGTVQSGGIISALASMDYIFVPIMADRVVMESSLSFASVIRENIIGKMGKLQNIYLFWNMVDGREKTELYRLYENAIAELGLPLMQTFIPDTKRYRKEVSPGHKPLFRSTFFPPDKYLVKGSGLDKLMDEFCKIVKP